MEVVMKIIIMEHTNILGIVMKYEAFYVGTITVRGERMHLLSEHENNIDYKTSFAISDEDFEKHCKFIEQIKR